MHLDKVLERFDILTDRGTCPVKTMKMTPVKFCLLLFVAILHSNLVRANDIIEVIANDVDMSSNDGELIFSSVVSVDMKVESF